MSNLAVPKFASFGNLASKSRQTFISRGNLRSRNTNRHTNPSHSSEPMPMALLIGHLAIAGFGTPNEPDNSNPAFPDRARDQQSIAFDHHFGFDDFIET